MLLGRLVWAEHTPDSVRHGTWASLEIVFYSSLVKQISLAVNISDLILFSGVLVLLTFFFFLFFLKVV